MKDIYVKFEGSELNGDSTDEKHKDWIEVSTFSHTVFQPKSSTASTAGGHTAERTEHGEMLFTKDIDKATSKLLRACSAGTLYPKVEIVFHRAFGGKTSTQTSQSRVDYYRILLEDVVVSSVTTNIGAGELPSETFGLKYGQIIWEYKHQNTKGDAPVSTGKAGWNLRTNKAVG
ncbi:Hcp family type VI secretion system effector [Aquabacterium humicola]|uniref:Hcp family type VI secretion system effector n=1 Tax=Aquabacterium humicola TaxID=3237377 RepID=UPI0025428CE5|nr:type VI secretion system tube protein Hcp [Rubrivivax pictus]